MCRVFTFCIIPTVCVFVGGGGGGGGGGGDAGDSRCPYRQTWQRSVKHNRLRGKNCCGASWLSLQCGSYKQSHSPGLGRPWFKHYLFNFDYTQSSKNFNIDTFLKVQMLAFCVHTWWRKPKNQGTTPRPWMGDHYPATCRHQDSILGRSGGKRVF